MMVKKKSMKDSIPFGVKFISIFLIITGILLILIGLYVFYVQLKLTMYNTTSTCESQAGTVPCYSEFSTQIFFFILLLMTLGILNIIASRGLLKGNKWSRKVAIILSVIWIILILYLIYETYINFLKIGIGIHFYPIFYVNLFLEIILLLIYIGISFYLTLNKKVKSYFK